MSRLASHRLLFLAATLFFTWLPQSALADEPDQEFTVIGYAESLLSNRPYVFTEARVRGAIAQGILTIENGEFRLKTRSTFGDMIFRSGNAGPIKAIWRRVQLEKKAAQTAQDFADDFDDIVGRNFSEPEKAELKSADAPQIMEAAAAALLSEHFRGIKLPRRFQMTKPMAGHLQDVKGSLDDEGGMTATMSSGETIALRRLPAEIYTDHSGAKDVETSYELRVSTKRNGKTRTLRLRTGLSHTAAIEVGGKPLETMEMFTERVADTQGISERAVLAHSRGGRPISSTTVNGDGKVSELRPSQQARITRTPAARFRGRGISFPAARRGR